MVETREGIEARRRPAELRSATAPLTTGMSSGLLFLLAHPDDEYFFAPRIRQAVQAGDNVYCIYTTDGTWYGVEPEVRIRESTMALRRLGVPEEHLFFIGVELGIKDGYSYLRLDQLYEAVCQTTRNLKVDEIHVLAWEGGHPDHDAGHLVGMALARNHGIERVYECAGYNSYRLPPRFFRVMKCVPRQGAMTTLRFGIREGLWYYSLCFCYRSQWKTFLGLSPGSFLRWVVSRRHVQRRVEGIDYTIRPHHGPLFYETRFGVSFDQFRVATADFVERHGLSGERPLDHISIKAETFERKQPWPSIPLKTEIA